MRPPGGRVRLTQDGERDHRLPRELVLTTHRHGGFQDPRCLGRLAFEQQHEALPDGQRYAAVQMVRGIDGAFTATQELTRARAVAELDETMRRVGARTGIWQSRQPEALRLPRTLQRGDDPLEMFDREAEPALRPIARSEVIVTGDLEADVLAPDAGFDASLSIADGPVVLRLRPVVLEKERVHDVQALRVVVSGSERFDVAENLEQTLQLAAAPQRRAQRETDVDRGTDELGRDIEMPQCLDDVPVVLDGLTIDTEGRGTIAGLTRVRGRLVPHFAAKRVMREPLDVLPQAAAVQHLDDADDLGVEQSAPFLKQAAVRHLVRERVLERILEIRKQLRLVEELRGLEIVQASSKRLLRDTRDARQQRIRHVLADHRGGFEELLVLHRQAIDTGRQDRLHALRNLQALNRLRQSIGAALAHERARLDQRADDLLEKERVPALQEQLLERFEAGVVADQRRQELGRALGRQHVEA